MRQRPFGIADDRHGLPLRKYEEMMIDQFEELLHQSAKRPLVFNVSVHPFIVGQPFRLRAYRRALVHILKRRDEIWVTTPGEIARHCETLPESVLPKS